MGAIDGSIAATRVGYLPHETAAALASLYWSKWTIEDTCSKTDSLGLKGVKDYSDVDRATAISALVNATHYARRAAAIAHFARWRAMLLDMLANNELEVGTYSAGALSIVRDSFSTFCYEEKPDLGRDFPDDGHASMTWSDWHAACDRLNVK